MMLFSWIQFVLVDSCITIMCRHFRAMKYTFVEVLEYFCRQ